jgi:D-alanine--poly(phosphoribitol) ligase subunit 2
MQVNLSTTEASCATSFDSPPAKAAGADSIKVELRAYIRDRYRVAEEDPDFTDDVHLYDYGYVDSFGAADLHMFVETRFSIKVGQSDLITFPLNTISQLADFTIKRQRGEI